MEPTSSFFIAQAIWGGFVNIAAVLSGEIAGSRTDQGLDYLHGQLKDRIDQFKPEANHDLDRAVYRAYLQACAQVLLKRHKELGYDSAAFIKAELLPAWSAEAVRRMRSIPNLGKSSETERQWIEAALTKFSNLLTLSQQPDFLKKITVHKELVEARDRYALLFRPPQGEKQIADLRTPLVQSVIDDLAQLHPDLPEGVTALVKAEWFDLFCGCFQTLFKADDKVQAIVLGKLLAGLLVQAENGQTVKVELDEKQVSEMLIKSLSETLREVVGELLAQQTATLTAVTQASEQRVITKVTNVGASIERLEKVIEAKAVFPPLALPPDWTGYHRERIAEWSKPQYDLQRRFVRLTLQFTYLDEERGNEVRPDAEAKTYQGLDELLAARPEFPVLVVLGDPGCGKSTLLRHLQWWHSDQRLKDGLPEISLLVSLNAYNGDKSQSPREWLAQFWTARYPKLPPLAEVLQSHRVLLLLDALNEMKPRTKLGEMMGDWRDYAQELVRGRQHRLVFTCRADDYETLLDCADDYPVPQVLAQRLTDDQMQQFVAHYAATDYVALIQTRLAADDALREFYRNPFFLKLLCEVVNRAEGEFPQGRASLFTSYVWDLLDRECAKHPNWQKASGLLNDEDHKWLKLMSTQKRPKFALPENGLLLPKLRELAFAMQQKGGDVTLSASETRALLNDEAHAPDILQAGLALSLLDELPVEDHTVLTFHYKFFHQLLQEYFAARQLARKPDWSLVQPDWSAEQFDAEFAALPKGAALPALKQSQWVETTVIAAPMADDPNRFVRELLAVNPVLAARCALAADLVLQPELKADIQTRLRAMLLDQTIDVRARIAAGEQLGWLGDTRFMRHQGKHGDYLLPPFTKTIAADKYPVGLKGSQYEDERKATNVRLATFRIAAFPVTNAEYRLFIEADGYQDERWWDTAAARDFLRTGALEQRRDGWRQTRKVLQDGKWTEVRLQELGEERGWNKETLDAYIKAATLETTAFEEWLHEVFQSVEPPTLPSFWDDSRFNNPAQPVVGVSWYEARAYCHWLTATVGDGRIFTLPTEAQFEAAARGKAGRLYPYGSKFETRRSNTAESRIRRTTPVGIFDNATPEGAYDLSGNVWTWTNSLYQNYPYDPNDGRENPETSGNRVLRGGSWNDYVVNARAVYRYDRVPADRYDNNGFRLVEVESPFWNH